MAKRDHFRHRERRRYSRKRFSNPHIRLPERRPLIVAMLSILAIFFCVLLSAYALKSPAFSYTSVEVIGFETEDPAEVKELADNYLQQTVAKVFERRNRFVFSSSNLLEQVSVISPLPIVSVTTNKHKVLITAKEPQLFLLWEANDQLSLVGYDGKVVRNLSQQEQEQITGPLLTFDIVPQVAIIDSVKLETGRTTEDSGKPENGEVYIELTNEEQATQKELQEEQQKRQDLFDRQKRKIELLRSIPIMHDSTDTVVGAGDIVLSALEANHLDQIMKHLNSLVPDWSNLTIDRRAGEWTSIVTPKGYRFIFSLLQDPERQLKNYVSILENNETVELIRSYIDVRFEDHVYIK